MSGISYAAAPVPVRDDIEQAHQRAWQRLARPGTWLSGAERVAVAAEARHAAACRLCAARRSALSRRAVDGAHEPLGGLGDAHVEAVHAIVSDPGRLSRDWFDGVIAGGLSETAYVETVGVLLSLVSIDTFARGLGMEPPPLPEPMDGAPGRLRPAAARPGGHWVATIAPEDAEAEEADLYAGTNGANIYRALSLVPDEARAFRDLDDALYLPFDAMFDFATQYRAISHAQIEFVAGRVSARNQCVY